MDWIRVFGSLFVLSFVILRSITWLAYKDELLNEGKDIKIEEYSIPLAKYRNRTLFRSFLGLLFLFTMQKSFIALPIITILLLFNIFVIPSSEDTENDKKVHRELNETMYGFFFLAKFYLSSLAQKMSRKWKK